MTAAGLRRAADALEALAGIEASTGVKFDGAYNGHVMLSVTDAADVTESLRLVRLLDGRPLDDAPPAEPTAVYALEFEVP